MPVDGDIILKAGLDTTGISKNLDKLTKSVSKGLKNAIRIGFGVRSIYALIRRLRKALFEGFGDLAKVYQPFNDAMSQIMTSLNLLKNTFAASFAPLIETVAPILSDFINRIAKAVAAVGQFIAALTGKEYVQAASVQVDYAASLDKSTSSSNKSTKATKAQTKAQKELNREITHFDDLVILHEKEDKDTDTTPTTTVTPQTTFSPVAIGDAISSFAQQFKAAWAEADFTDIGRMVGEKLRDALDEIEWNKVKEKCNKVAKSVATFINGYVSAPGIAKSVGTTIGEMINTAIGTANSFISTLDWSSVGAHVRDRMNYALRTIDWNLVYTTASNFGYGLAAYLTSRLDEQTFGLVGYTLSNVLRTVFKFLNSFGDELERRNGFAQFGDSIAAFLTKGFDNFPFNEIRHAINVWVHGILTTITHAVTRTPWNKIGTDISTFIYDVLTDINWEEDVYPAVNGAASGLADFLNGLFDEDTFAAVGTTAANLLNTAFEFLNTFGTTFKFQQFGASLARGINNFLINFNADRLAAGVNALVKGLRDAIIAFLSEINWYQFGVKLRDVIKDINWEVVFTSLGRIIWEAINAAIELAKGILDTGAIGDPFIKLLNQLKEDVNAVASQIDFESIKQGIEKIVTVLGNIAEGFGEGFLNFFEVLNQIGIAFFELFGPALGVIGDNLGKIDPEILKAIGSALGFIVGFLLTVKLLSGVVGIITSIASALLSVATGASAATAALGTGGLLATLGPVILGILAFAGALAVLDEEIATQEEEFANFDKQYQDTEAIIERVAGKFGLTTEQVQELSWRLKEVDTHTTDATGTFEQLDTMLRNSGVDVEAFHKALGDVASEAEKDGKNIDGIAAYISNVGESADTTTGHTTDVGNALSALNDMSWSTPLKLALIKAAIDGLGKSGKLSDEDIQKIHSTLDEYDPSKPEESMGRIATAFGEAGIKADEFNKAIPEGLESVKKEIPKKEKGIISQIELFGLHLGEEAEKGGKNAGKGLVDGIESENKSIVDSFVGVTKGAVDAMKGSQGLDENSPSKKTKEIGKYAGQGLALGLKEETSFIKVTTRNVVKEMADTISTGISKFSTYGVEVIKNIKSGLSNNAYTLKTEASNIASDMYDEFNSDWYGLGTNIAQGIYDGLFNQASWLNTLAWNTAVNMYNNACRALGIASPSKKFAWIGEMVARGLGRGVTDNQDIATDAVSDMTTAMTEEAEKTNPAVTISTTIDDWIDALNDVLTRFSETVINRFDSLANTLIQVGNAASMGLPAIAQGRVIPSSVSVSNTSATNSANMARMLENLTANQITVDELRPLLIEMFNDYMNLAWYVGDEQIARHANNGNLILNRRYSTIKP